MAGREADNKRDQVLTRLLKTPPQPKTPKKPKVEPPPDNDDPEALMDWAKRNIQADK